MERGNNDYALFAHLIKSQAHFVTRLLSNALVETLKDYRVDEGAEIKGVVSDHLVVIGKDGAGFEVRTVVFRHLDGKEYPYIPSHFDISATDIVELYLNCWSIETFFLDKASSKRCCTRGAKVKLRCLNGYHSTFKAYRFKS